MTGVFITFEGGEGAGKSTQITRLSDFLRAQGRSVITTREPGGTTGAEEIRNLLVAGDPNRWDAMTELFLISAARRDHWRRVIQPALSDGTWVLCDRFSDSTIAYQAYGRGLDKGIVRQVSGLATDGRIPDLTLIFDIDPLDGLTRAATRRGTDTRYESFALDFHIRLREGFMAIAQDEPKRCAIIDASLSIDQVENSVRRAVLQRFAVA